MSVATPAAVTCRGLMLRYGAIDALVGADLTVEAGSLTAVIGPSGCGKTTLLRAVAGFESPHAGEVTIAGRTVIGTGIRVPARQRGIGMVFQDYALFPHLDVAGNVGYALGRRPDGARIAEMLDLVGLAGLGDRRPHELSGGQQQRVALARALVARPPVVLLDEPFSNLDAALRQQVRSEVKAILSEAGVSALLVTHDQEEALSLADRLAVMRAGTVVQADEPRAVYADPVDLWVAGFLGVVECFRGEVSGGRVATALGPIDAGAITQGAVDVLVRPEDISMAAEGDSAVPGAAVPGTVRAGEYFGHDQLVTVALADGRTVRHRGPGGQVWRTGERVRLWLAGTATVVPALTPTAAAAEDRPS